MLGGKETELSKLSDPLSGGAHLFSLVYVLGMFFW